CRPSSGPKGNGKAHGLRKIAEKAERSGQGGSSSGLPSCQLGVAGEKSLQESSASEEETQDEKIAPLSESVTDDFQVDSSSSTGELVSGLSSQHDISSSLLSYSITDSYTECKSFEENASSFPSPELFRGPDYVDWECPKLEEYMQCKNSTLLDTSKAIAIEKAPQFSNLSSILATSSEDYQKCHRKIMITLADENIFPKLKSASESDNAACEVLAEKTYPLTPEKTKKKNTNPTTPDNRRGLLTSTPTSQTAGLEIDLSSVQKASLEELFPNVSNCVNSDEIVPVSSLQEHSSSEVPLNTSEICCIIRASPGTRQVKSKGVIVKKKKYSLPKDIPQGTLFRGTTSRYQGSSRKLEESCRGDLGGSHGVGGCHGRVLHPWASAALSSSESTLPTTRRGRTCGRRLKVQPPPRSRGYCSAGHGLRQAPDGGAKPRSLR
ncbi:PREDICTED: meiosis-specific kinetochore protein, partial [Miniopterus natalensis]|uniref:meiosis-specific kinetochore protein n=1 Tax=Miniopterus natalensis TaxID=291302 RepID=UPI0007A6C71D